MTGAGGATAVGDAASTGAAARGAPRGDRLAQASRDSIEAGSKSFAVASRLFDPVTRDSARHFYAWCRHCDDAIDGQVAGFVEARPIPVGAHAAFDADAAREAASNSARRFARLEAETRAAMAGRPSEEPAFAALARIARRHRLPDFVPLDILDGFRMDVEGRGYRTLDDLFGYCYGVAGAVGIGMAIVMGVDPGDAATLDRACDLGLAFQLTNIARDVMDDARAGRVYLPAELFGRERVDAAFVLADANRPVVVAAAHALLELAERYYASARIGIAGLPWRSAWAVATALRVYREIGRRVRRAPDPWAARQSVPAWRKLMHVAGASAAPALTRLRHGAASPRTGLWTRPER